MKTNSNFPVVALRLVVPFTIFISPFWGAVASLIADSIDVILIDIFSMVEFKNYSLTDKVLDTYYLIFEYIQSLSWSVPGVVVISSSLLLFRLLGLLAYIITRNRKVYVIFPNIFEYYYLAMAFCLYFLHYSPGLDLQLELILLLIPVKLFQEYVCHIREYNMWDACLKKYFNSIKIIF